MLEEIEVLGEVTDTGFSFVDKESVRSLMRGFKRGMVLCKFKAHRETRSSAQNRYYHGVVLPIFMAHCGFEKHQKQEMKDALALELLPREIVDVRTGEVKVVPGHTSELNTKEFNEFIESLQRLGAELGLYIPDPGEDVTGRKGKAA